MNDKFRTLKSLIYLAEQLALKNEEYLRGKFIFGSVPKMISFLILISGIIQFAFPQIFAKVIVTLILIIFSIIAFTIDLISEKQIAYINASDSIEGYLNKLKRGYNDLLDNSITCKEFNSIIYEVEENQRSIKLSVLVIPKFNLKKRINNDYFYAWIYDAKDEFSRAEKQKITSK